MSYSELLVPSFYFSCTLPSPQGSNPESYPEQNGSIGGLCIKVTPEVIYLGTNAFKVDFADFMASTYLAKQKKVNHFFLQLLEPLFTIFCQTLIKALILKVFIEVYEPNKIKSQMWLILKIKCDRFNEIILYNLYTNLIP